MQAIMVITTDGKLDAYDLMHASLNYQLGNVDLTF